MTGRIAFSLRSSVIGQFAFPISAFLYSSMCTSQAKLYFSPQLPEMSLIPHHRHPVSIVLKCHLPFKIMECHVFVLKSFPITFIPNLLPVNLTAFGTF